MQLHCLQLPWLLSHDSLAIVRQFGVHESESARVHEAFSVEHLVHGEMPLHANGVKLSRASIMAGLFVARSSPLR